MTSTWSDRRSRDKAEGRTNEKLISELKERLMREQRAYALAEVRQQLGLTQKQLAEAMHVGQARISKIESGDIEKSELQTIHAYVVALGGELEINAKFGDQRIAIA